MAQKNATPTKEQQAIIRRWGQDPRYWTVIKDLPNSLIIRHRATKQVEIIEK